MSLLKKKKLFQCFFKKIIYLFGHTTRHAKLPHPRIEPVPPAVEAQSLNHWTTREVPNAFKNSNEYFIQDYCDKCHDYGNKGERSGSTLHTAETAGGGQWMENY